MGLVDTTKTETLQVPHEEGEWVSIRALLATEMDEAKEVRMKRVMDLWGDSLDQFTGQAASSGGPQIWGQILDRMNEVFEDVDLSPEAERQVSQALDKLRREGGQETEETLAQRVAQYDALTLLKYAVVSWSYDYPVKSGSLEHVELLDGMTRDWLVEEIVKRNTRPLASERLSGGSLSLASAHQNSNISLSSEGLESF